MADDNMDMVSADMDGAEEPYVSDEMKQILADIEAQDKVIEEARAAKKSLQAAKRRQARLDAKEAERLAREREQAEALALLRKLRSSTLRKNDGTSINAYEYVTALVTAQGVANGSRRGSDGSVSEPSNSR